MWSPRLEMMPARSSRVRTGESTVTSRLWYRAVLCDALLAARQVPILAEHFADAVGTAGWPDGACLFLTGRQTTGGIGDDGTVVAPAVFFSPAAIAVVPHLIASCGAEPSPPPDRAVATLVVGRQSDWDLLSREHH